MSQRSVLSRDNVCVRAAAHALPGNLALPDAARGVVLFAHGSGSSRHSSRNRFVADLLNQADLATLLFDLLNPEESTEDERTGRLRFDVPLLAQRMTGAVDWIAQQAETRGLPVGLFGASTGAAAALIAAAQRPNVVDAVVSRGGRPDLAGAALREVRSPTLFVVGEQDAVVLELNRDAAQKLYGVHQVEVVPGATHLFEEPGALARAADLARDWFMQFLR